MTTKRKWQMWQKIHVSDKPSEFLHKISLEIRASTHTASQRQCIYSYTLTGYLTLIYPEDGHTRFFQHVGTYLPNCVTWYLSTELYCHTQKN